LHLQERHAGTAAGRAEVRAMGHHARARRRLEHRHGLRGRDPGRLADRKDEEVRAGSAGRGRGARPAGIAVEQPVVRAGHDSHVHRHRADHGAVGQSQPARARFPAHGVLHAHGAAHGGGGQHLAVLLHAAVRPDRAGDAAVRLARTELAGQPRDRAARADARDGMEGGRLLHDLLPGRLADRVAVAARSRHAGRGVALAVFPPHPLAAA
uniref:Transferred entry: 7.1.1.2 n=1 Tax=Parastrongyloides trichosuri TaxID=131310 RepID=A0A0N5A5Q0_PARTI